jgi:hypothetical protein
VKTNLIRWNRGSVEDERCECGEVQNMEHLLRCPLCPVACSMDDMWSVTDSAVDVARFWADRL